MNVAGGAPRMPGSAARRAAPGDRVSVVRCGHSHLHPAGSLTASGRGRPGVLKTVTEPSLPCMDSCAVSAFGFLRSARTVGPAEQFFRGAKVLDTHPVARCPRPRRAGPGEELARHPQLLISVNRCRSPLVLIADHRPMIYWEMMSTLKPVVFDQRSIVSFVIFCCSFCDIIVNLTCRRCVFAGGPAFEAVRRPEAARSWLWPHTRRPEGTQLAARSVPARSAADALARRCGVRRDHP